jgi:hypothetical protein
MPRKHNRHTTPRPNGPDHDVRLTYDVPNDEYFVACFTCGREGTRCRDEKQAKIAWTKGQFSKET